jgi:hypothetical protein
MANDSLPIDSSLNGVNDELSEKNEMKLRNFELRVDENQ